MGKTVGERLLEQIDTAEKTIERLEMDKARIIARLESSFSGWCVPRTEETDSHPDLPLPRLEIEWLPDPEFEWRAYAIEYRMVYKSLLNGITIVPLGRTDRKTSPLSPKGPPYAEMTLERLNNELPISDGPSAHHAATHLRMPLYAITPEGAVRLDVAGADFEGQRKRGVEDRRE